MDTSHHTATAAATAAPPSTAAERSPRVASSPLQRVQHLLHSHPAISPLLVLIVSWLVFTQLNPRFATRRHALAGPPAGRRRSRRSPSVRR